MSRVMAMPGDCLTFLRVVLIKTPYLSPIIHLSV
jgi:hypothetical protein